MTFQNPAERRQEILDHYKRADLALFKKVCKLACSRKLEGIDRASAFKIIDNIETAEPKRGWQDEARAILAQSADQARGVA